MNIENHILNNNQTPILNNSISNNNILNTPNDNNTMLESIPSMISNIDQKVVDVVYCNAQINNIPLYLILDTGSVKNIMSKSFIDTLNIKIEKPSNINITDINEGQQQSLGIINGLPLELENTIISMNIEVNNTYRYILITGVE